MAQRVDGRLLEMLCCPVCRHRLEEVGAVEEAGSEEGAGLVCVGCGEGFPIIDSIPVLIPNALAHQAQLVQRYWDSAEKAALYDQKVEGAGDIFGTYLHRSEIHGSVSLYRSDNLDRILDAGCGNGRFMETFPATALKVGVDASLNLLRIARSKGRGDFHVCCELEHLPFRDGQFGTVTCCRVLQHLHHQAEAVAEMGRVTRFGGDLILQIYNSWNLKTLYKAIRSTPWLARICDAPFRLLFRSMSPFSPWGLDYDQYNSWFELKRWMRQAGMGRMVGRGVGFGFHKYLMDPFYINAVLNKRAPGVLRGFYQACFAWERLAGAVRPLPWLMEKCVLRGEKLAQPESSVLDAVGKTIAHAYHASPLVSWEAWQEWRQEQRETIRDNHFHIQEAVSWLLAAHDATPDHGVSRGYAAGWSSHFKSHGWQPSYPETTGYIIPTFYDCAVYLKNDDLARRALAMADWEIDVQLPSGAVRGGTIDRSPSPAVFNTGQVILGWLRAEEESGEARFLEAAERAGRFLVRRQEPDGRWCEGNSAFADQKTTTYNARVGWALVLLGARLGEKVFRDAGVRSILFTLSQQEANGWFRNNCLSDPQAPLLHTICYAVEGVMGAAAVLGEATWQQRAAVTADALLSKISPEGRIPGRLDRDWNGTVAWDCLTGSAQLAAILLRLGGSEQRSMGAERLMRFLKGTQNCQTRCAGIRGGIKGSYPFNGGYGRFELLNWATKFYIDALLLDEKRDKRSSCAMKR